MQDTGYSGYIWDRSTIKTAMILGTLLVFTVLILLSSYEIHLNTLQRIAIERAAGEILGTKVSIGGYYPRPKQNLIVFTEVKIANPPGLPLENQYTYDVDQAIKIGVIRMKADSLSANKMVFNEVILRNGRIRLLVNRYQTNLLALHANINRKAAAGSAKVIIKNLHTEGMILEPSVAQPDRIYTPRDLEPLHIADLGEKEDGIAVAEALARIVNALCREAFSKGARIDVLSSMSKDALAEIQKGMDMGPRFMETAVRGTEDWGDWNTRDFIKNEKRPGDSGR